MYIYIYDYICMWLYVIILYARYLCLALQQSQLVLQQSEWQQQSRLLNCPTFQLSHAASNGLEQFMENPEMPTDQGLFQLAFIGLELTQNGLNMSAWCWRRMENGQSRQGMSGGYLSVVWHLFESTTRDKQWTLETTAATRTRRAFFLTRFSNSKLSRFLQPSALSQEVGTICHSLEVSAL